MPRTLFSILNLECLKYLSLVKLANKFVLQNRVINQLYGKYDNPKNLKNI